MARGSSTAVFHAAACCTALLLQGCEKPSAGHIPAVHVPAVHLPEVHLPEVHPPEVHVPAVHFPAVHVPAVHLPAVHVPKVQLPAALHVPAALPAFLGLNSSREAHKPVLTEHERVRTASIFIACPAGYKAHETPTWKHVPGKARRAIAHCGFRCDRLANCQGFRFSPSDDRCVILHHRQSPDGILRDYQFCEKKALRHFGYTEAPLYKAEDFVEQEDAVIPVGGNIGIYAVGSSSLLWMTWIDQLHLVLRRLGFQLPPVHMKAGGRFYPKQVPKCDDSKYFEYLKTARFGRIGWSSWDFAYEGWEGCRDGFRDIGGNKVKCQHGAGCAFSKNPLKASYIAEDASKADIALVATWFNDDQQWSTHYKCFDGEKRGTHQVAPLTITCLLRTIRSIHARNPRTWVLIMGKYPQTYHHITYKFVNIYNGKVKAAVEKEPRTLFIDFYMPNDSEGQFFQVAHSGHPNCRGSKIMAYAVMDRLYKERVLARSLRLLDGGKKEDVLNRTCDALDTTACHTSAFCWVDPALGRCTAYGAGTWNYHTVCVGSICEGPSGHFV